MKVNVIFAILLAAVLIATVSTSAVSASSPLTWHLDSDSHHVAGKVMEQAGTQAGSVTIQASSEQIWLADEAASSDVTIAGGWWMIQLHGQTDIEPEDFDAMIGYYDGSFNEIETGQLYSFKIGENYIEYEIQIDPATIEEGHYLALKIVNNDSEDHVISTGEEGPDGYGSSWLQSPCIDPGYPSPELSSAILLGVGLVGLLGYLGIRRRKAS